MNCESALEILDCVRPNSNDLELPEMTEARAHLDACEACRVEFQRRQEFDREVSRVAVELPVPDSVRVSLLARFAEPVQEFSDSNQTTRPAPDATPADTRSSDPAVLRFPRRVQVTGILSACLLVAAVTTWLSQPSNPQISLATLKSEFDLNLPRVTFDGSFPVRLPPSWASNPGLTVSETLSGIDLDGRAGHDAAAGYFAFTAGRGAPVRGVLVAIPAEKLRDVPSETVFSRAPPAYPQKGIVAVAWQERDLVYLCFVPGDTTLLERVQRGMISSAA